MNSKRTSIEHNIILVYEHFSNFSQKAREDYIKY